MKSLAVPPKIVSLREEKKKSYSVCVLLEQLFPAIFLKVLRTYSRHMCEVDSVGS